MGWLSLLTGAVILVVRSQTMCQHPGGGGVASTGHELSEEDARALYTPGSKLALFCSLQKLEREPGEAKWLDIIEKDLHRQFPFHEMFAARGGHG